MAEILVVVMTSDVSAPSVGALHTLYSKVSIHEAPAALHDMAFTKYYHDHKLGMSKLKLIKLNLSLL